MDAKIEKILKNFKESWDAYPIVRCMFTRTEMIEILSHSGITPRGGRRFSNFPTSDLALAVSNVMDSMSNKELRHILSSFVRKNSDLIERYSKMSVSKMQQYLNGIVLKDVNPKELVAILFAVVMDNRKSFNALKSRVLALVEAKTLDMDKVWEIGKSKPPVKEEITKTALTSLSRLQTKSQSRSTKSVLEIEKEIEKYREKIEEYRRKCDDLMREIGRIRSRTQSMRKHVDEIKMELKELRRREAELIQKNKKLERENQELKERLKALQQQQPPSETELMLRLEKHIRKLRDSMDYYVQKLGSIEEQHAHDVQNILNEISKLKSHVIEVQESAAQGFDAQKDALLTLSKELSDLRHSVNRLAHSIERVEHKEHRETTGGNRIGVFVDVQNLYYAAKDMGGKPDYRKLKDFILSGRRPVGLYAYVVINPSTPDQERFLHFLENEGFTVKSRFVKKFFDGNMKGNWDLGIAVDMIEQAEKMDIVALVSGDGDFAPVVRMLQRMGKKVEVYSFENTISSELREAADMCKLLDFSFIIPE
ncbi:MAG: hypothetical protein DRQ10_00430 [Candidatus Hydrothermota bacterium]|nr:MAG: hypothetical protein DRQ10_00430 [Candidatus Hydrothermae bacterium]